MFCTSCRHACGTQTLKLTYTVLAQHILFFIAYLSESLGACGTVQALPWIKVGLPASPVCLPDSRIFSHR